MDLNLHFNLFLKKFQPLVLMKWRPRLLLIQLLKFFSMWLQWLYLKRL
jgi:hypothetical protein